MRTFILSSLAILLLSINHTAQAQQQKEYTYHVKIVNSKGKPQPNIYAYHENYYTKERKYFKSDKNGMMTITSTEVSVDMYIDAEKSNGLHRKFFHFYREPKESIVYDTKKEIEKAMKGKVLTTIQEHPEYPGGIEECIKFLHKKAWEHPVIKKENSFHANRIGIPQSVIIQFIIDKKGNIKYPAVVRGLGSPIDQAAIDIILSMPKWEPGKHKGKPVNCLFALPVRVLFI